MVQKIGFVQILIQLIECPIPLSSAAAADAPSLTKPGWRYLGNEKSYRRSAGVGAQRVLRLLVGE